MFRLWRLAAVLLVALAGWGFEVPAASRAERARARLGERLERITVAFEAFQAESDRRIPAEILREARGLVIVQETQAGFILGGRKGEGVVLIREDGRWTWPAFLRSSQGSVGLQAGWQRATHFQVLMTAGAVDALRTNRFRLGVDLRVTSGPRTMGDEAKTQSLGSDVLLYSDTGGVFGGLTVEGGSLRSDEEANQAYYGATGSQVLFGEDLPAGDEAIRLTRLVTEASSTGGGP